jgi:hypothetical protein
MLLTNKPKGASPRMFSVSCVCTYVLLEHAGMVHRGGSINSYGIACSIAIPPLALVGPILYLLGVNGFFSDCSML